MTGIPLAKAKAIVADCINDINRVTPNTVEAQIMASGMIINALEETRKRLTMLIGSGYQLQRLQSTLLLVNEAMKRQEEIRGLQGNQKSRMLSIQSGLNEVR